MADTTETLKKLVTSLEKSIKSKTEEKDKLTKLLDHQTTAAHDLSSDIEKYKKEAKDENRELTTGEANFIAQHSKSVTEHKKKIDVIKPKLDKLLVAIAELGEQLKTAKADLKTYEAEKGKLDKKDKDYEKKKKELQKKIKSKI